MAISLGVYPIFRQTQIFLYNASSNPCMPSQDLRSNLWASSAIYWNDSLTWRDSFLSQSRYFCRPWVKNLSIKTSKHTSLVETTVMVLRSSHFPSRNPRVLPPRPCKRAKLRRFSTAVSSISREAQHYANSRCSNTCSRGSNGLMSSLKPNRPVFQGTLAAWWSPSFNGLVGWENLNRKP